MIIDGKELANKIKEKDKEYFSQYKTSNLRLVVATIGDDPASKVYVRNKEKAAREVGLGFENLRFSTTDSFLTIKDRLEALATDGGTVGLIIQLPIVSDVLTNEEKTMLISKENGLNPQLDVDGFVNPKITPCTPKGIMKMLDSLPNYKLEGKLALVVGRSNIVGKPIAKLLLDRNCTVIQAHSKTPKNTLIKLFAQADIVVSAVGKANLLTEEDVEDISHIQDKIIIDVGMNRDENGKLCGDLSEAFKEKYATHYSPVPGGVGPMTVAMVVDNIKDLIELRKNPEYCNF